MSRLKLSSINQKIASLKLWIGTRFSRRQLMVILIAVVSLALWGAFSLRATSDKITAQPAASTAKSAIVPQTDTCEQSNTVTFTCYKNLINKVTASYGPESAAALIKQQYPKVDFVKAECHQLVHVLGRAALAKYGNIADTYAHGDQFCWSGYYHGALEQLAQEKGIDFLVKNSNAICASVPGKANHSFYYYNCVHGLGHGYMFVEAGQLFKSLSDCDSLTDDFDRSSCYGGVFMQNIMNEQSPDTDTDHPTASLKPDEPMYPCTAASDKYKGQCYLMQTSYALQVESYDFSKVFQLCGQIELSYQDTCYTSLGRDASGQSISDVDKTRVKCLLGPTLEAQRFCIEGAAKDFVSYFHGDAQAKQLCNSLPKNLLDDCLDTVRVYYAAF